MKIVNWLGCLVVGSCLMIFAAVAASGATFNVFAIDVSLSGSFLDDESGMEKLGKLKVDTTQLLNVARGREPSAVVPAGEVLAWAQNCVNGEVRIIVFDTNSETVLTTVAVTESREAVEDLKKGAFAVLLTVEDTGDGSNSVEGGAIMVTGTFTVVEGDCPTKVKAAAYGFMEVVVTDDVGTQDVELVITKGKVSVGGQIGNVDIVDN